MINLIMRNNTVFFIETDIAVWRVVEMLNDGATEAEVYTELPDLPKGAVQSARVYYSVHQDEIDKDVAAERNLRRRRAKAG